MEKMPFQADREAGASLVAASIVETDWRQGLPVLSGSKVTLRELRLSDAPSLFTMLTTDEVARFISPPPTSVEGFERFIEWTARQRAAGEYVCFAVVVEGSDAAVGLFQVRSLEPGFASAEWGFALGSMYWGTGVFVEGARLVLEFVFERMHVYRLEARAAVRNGRGNGALRKTGAIQEGIMRRSFLRNGEYLDQVLWSMVAEDYHQAKAVWGPRVH